MRRQHGFPLVEIDLPAWVATVLPPPGTSLGDDESRMSLVIELARRNVLEGTGGPFGAAVFDRHGRVVAPGVNRVEPLGCSVAHAEIVALAMAQAEVGTYDLNLGPDGGYELFSSTEPCAMCLGAVPWSGVRRLVCGARKEDAEAVGFDEGARPESWITALEQRGITVALDVQRSAAKSVLDDYTRAGGTLYNSRRPRA